MKKEIALAFILLAAPAVAADWAPAYRDACVPVRALDRSFVVEWGGKKIELRHQGCLGGEPRPGNDEEEIDQRYYFNADHTYSLRVQTVVSTGASYIQLSYDPGTYGMGCSVNHDTATLAFPLDFKDCGFGTSARLSPLP